ncbi:MAG TPA: type II toxin-antitoxin system VapC family toxin [Solirubrobacteraceae bacterium]|nr:type II toxin-antitoxin system VapC family toxin [Solirubrobacteraceae bacterium]
MLVVDASAMLDAIAAREPALELPERLSEDGDLHAPELIDVEILRALRRLRIRKEITAERAADVRTDFAETSLLRYPHEPLSDRIWELCHHLSAYDAAFVALAEALDAPLVTCDARLAHAGGHGAYIELFEPALFY